MTTKLKPGSSKNKVAKKIPIIWKVNTIVNWPVDQRKIIKRNRKIREYSNYTNDSPANQ